MKYRITHNAPPVTGLVGLVGRTNAAPAFGAPAGALLFVGATMDRPGEVVIEIVPAPAPLTVASAAGVRTFKVYDEADFSPVAHAVPVPDDPPDDGPAPDAVVGGPQS